VHLSPEQHIGELPCSVVGEANVWAFDAAVADRYEYAEGDSNVDVEFRTAKFVRIADCSRHLHIHRRDRNDRSTEAAICGGTGPIFFVTTVHLPRRAPGQVGWVKLRN
jgi:hypothetical protein